jgi:hypothetical protein
MPELIDHVGYLERSLQAAKLPISVRYVDGADIFVITRRRGKDRWTERLKSANGARLHYIALRARLLNGRAKS